MKISGKTGHAGAALGSDLTTIKRVLALTKKPLYLGAALLQAAALGTNAQPIQNASFESPNVGPVGSYYSFQYDPTGAVWAFVGNAGIAANGSGFADWNAGTPVGNQFAFLQGGGFVGGSMSQTLTGLTAGTYGLTFLASQRDIIGRENTENQIVMVLVDGANAGSFTPPDTNWYSFQATIPLNGGNHVLTFTNYPVAGDASVRIDKVGLAPVQTSLNVASWLYANPPLTNRQNHTATLLQNGKVLIAGGDTQNFYSTLSSAELYDPASGTWTATGGMSAPRAHHTATLLADGKVLVAGGDNATGNGPSAEIYDPATGTWTATGEMHFARVHHTATLLTNGQVLVVGGFNSNYGYLDYPEVYDPGGGTWAIGTRTFMGRAYHTATLLQGGSVLVAGGYHTNGSLLYGELYGANGAYSGWVASAPGAYKGTATLLPNGKVLAAGGIGQTCLDCSGPVRDAYLYDPFTQTTVHSLMNTARALHTATLLPNGQVLVAGGSGDGTAELYDPATGTWTPTARMNNWWFSGNTATLLPNGRVLAVGSLVPPEQYDYANMTWTETVPLSTNRAGHTATLLPSGQVLVSGGANYLTASTERYTPATRTWTPAGAMNSPRAVHTATLLPNGKVLVAGGVSNCCYLASAELYDPASDTWTMTAPMSVSRVDHTATLLRNGEVLVAGGNAGPALAAVEVYSPATASWMTANPLNTPRNLHTATLLPSGNVLAAGGLDGNGNCLSSVEVYGPAGGWTIVNPMNNPRLAHTATLLPNGRVLVTGGYGASGSLSSAEIYDPVAGTWTTTGPMSSPRFYHTATLLPNGRVLVLGGHNPSVSPNMLASTELYDPSTGTWATGNALNVARYIHTATLLPDGNILAAGGFSTNTSGFGSLTAELYDAGLGFNPAWQPQITTFTSPLTLGSSLVLTGSQFRGVSEGAGGNSLQDSPADYPLVQLRSVESGQTAWFPLAPGATWSPNSFTSASVANFPPGWTLATVFVNGIPSPSSLLRIDAVPLLPIVLNGSKKLANGAFEFGFTNTPAMGFTVLGTTDLTSPSDSWMVLGSAAETAPGQFSFTDLQAGNYAQRFYRVRSP